jgi:hypothetical protein
MPELFGPTKTTMSSNSISTGLSPIPRKLLTLSLCSLGLRISVSGAGGVWSDVDFFLAIGVRSSLAHIAVKTSQ